MEILQSIGVDISRIVQIDTIASVLEKLKIEKEKAINLGLDLNEKIGSKKQVVRLICLRNENW